MVMDRGAVFSPKKPVLRGGRVSLGCSQDSCERRGRDRGWKRNKKVARKRRLRLRTVPPLDLALGTSYA